MTVGETKEKATKEGCCEAETYRKDRLSAFMRDDFCALLHFLKKSISNGELSNEFVNKAFGTHWTIEKMIDYWEVQGTEANSEFVLRET
jgi:hypothetical protein